MADNKEYIVQRGQVCIIFDSKGYILKAKGLGSLMWSKKDIDENIIGKHIDELSEMLEKYALSKEIYLEFEAYIHVWILQKILKNMNN